MLLFLSYCLCLHNNAFLNLSKFAASPPQINNSGWLIALENGLLRQFLYLGIYSPTSVITTFAYRQPQSPQSASARESVGFLRAIPTRLQKHIRLQQLIQVLMLSSFHGLHRCLAPVLEGADRFLCLYDVAINPDMFFLPVLHHTRQIAATAQLTFFSTDFFLSLFSGSS